ncbi:hypothetical protein PsorP6_004662 [Peronosclerospora sorghi]|uniref:Uncharacterized protein n=1 Tax=Peronosclerospora sorghi TaxID=230839 RepID=A0ACC0VN44_9STRA|nr:hypothetical protein PsorP6_004662 [Peronosclerospora sorghi]
MSNEMRGTSPLLGLETSKANVILMTLRTTLEARFFWLATYLPAFMQASYAPNFCNVVWKIKQRGDYLFIRLAILSTMKALQTRNNR